MSSRLSRIGAGIAAALLLLIGALSAPASASPRNVVGGCPDIIAIGARGSGQPYAAHVAGFGPQAGKVAAAAVAKSHLKTVRYVAVPYPAVNATDVRNYGSSVADGVWMGKRIVTGLVRDCPRTKLVLVGYSQGAQVMHRVAFELTASQASHVASVTLIADPTRNKADDMALLWSWGAWPLANGVLGGGIRVPSYLANKTFTICNEADPVCNSPAGPVSWGKALTGKFNFAAHTSFYTAKAAEIAKFTYLGMFRNGAR